MCRAGILRDSFALIVRHPEPHMKSIALAPTSVDSCQSTNYACLASDVPLNLAFLNLHSGATASVNSSNPNFNFALEQRAASLCKQDLLKTRVP